jgi:hypothetical protein
MKTLFEKNEAHATQKAPEPDGFGLNSASRWKPGDHSCDLLRDGRPCLDRSGEASV